METPPAPPGTTKKSTVNSLSKSSLNLTPCRRLGLGRPSSGSLKKPLHLRVVDSTPQNKAECSNSKLESVSTASEESQAEILRDLVDNGNVLNKVTVGTKRVRRCLKISSKIPSPNYISINRVTDSDTTPKNTVLAEETQCKDRLSSSKRRRLNLKNTSVYCDNDCDSVGEQTCTESESVCSPPEACSDGNEIQTPAEVTPEIISQLIATIKDKKKKLEQLKVQDVYIKKHNLKELREQTAKWRAAGQEALRYSVDLARRAGFPVTLSQLMAQHGFPPQLMGYNSDDDEFT